MNLQTLKQLVTSPIAVKSGIGIGAGAAGLGAGLGIGAVKAKNDKTELTQAFNAFNDQENAAMIGKFKTMNAQENKAIANHFYREGANAMLQKLSQQ